MGIIFSIAKLIYLIIEISINQDIILFILSTLIGVLCTTIGIILSRYYTIQWAKKSSPSVNTLNAIREEFKKLISEKNHHNYGYLNKERHVFNGNRLNSYVSEFVDSFKNKKNSIADYKNMLSKKQCDLFNELEKFVNNIDIHKTKLTVYNKLINENKQYFIDFRNKLVPENNVPELFRILNEFNKIQILNNVKDDNVNGLRKFLDENEKQTPKTINNLLNYSIELIINYLNQYDGDLLSDVLKNQLSSCVWWGDENTKTYPDHDNLCGEPLPRQ